MQEQPPPGLARQGRGIEVKRDAGAQASESGAAAGVAVRPLNAAQGIATASHSLSALKPPTTKARVGHLPAKRVGNEGTSHTHLRPSGPAPTGAAAATRPSPRLATAGVSRGIPAGTTNRPARAAGCKEES